jgi:hypothetical protein
MKCIHNKRFISQKLIVIHVSGLYHRKVSFRVRLTRMHRHISATMLGTIWTEIWLGK